MRDSDLISKLEQEINNICSSISRLGYNIETNPIENDIKEIQKKVAEITSKYKAGNNSLNIQIPERYKLDEYYSSIINIKDIISKYEEKINISNIEDGLAEPGRGISLKEVSELRIYRHGEDENNISENEFGENSEGILNLLDEDNEDYEEYSYDDCITVNKAHTEYRNSMGFCVEVFPKICTEVLDSSFQNKLIPLDSMGKHIQYTPRMVWHNHRDDFPSVPLFDFYNPLFFTQLELDTLFFIFYFQQGTFQQFLAIQELKRKKWRFHKKCFAWFSKRSDSKIINEEVDVADYIYFDFEKDWCQKIKNDFAFEFIHLDDTRIVTNKFFEISQRENEANGETVMSDDNNIGFETIE